MRTLQDMSFASKIILNVFFPFYFYNPLHDIQDSNIHLFHLINVYPACGLNSTEVRYTVGDNWMVLGLASPEAVIRVPWRSRNWEGVVYWSLWEHWFQDADLVCHIINGALGFPGLSLRRFLNWHPSSGSGRDGGVAMPSGITYR